MESKGLEALERIRFCPLDKWQKQECWKVIEKELQDYEETKKELAQVMKYYQDLGNSCYKKLKALEIISKAYGDYANHKISEYELIMTIGENTTC